MTLIYRVFPVLVITSLKIIDLSSGEFFVNVVVVVVVVVVVDAENTKRRV